MNLVLVEQIESHEDYINRTAGEESLKGQVQALENELNKVNSTMGEITGSILSMEEELQETFSDLKESQEALIAELNALNESIEANKTEEQKEESKAREQQREEFNRRREEGSQDRHSDKLGKSDAVKKLFKKISLKTHPDRTQKRSEEEKKILHELFLEAKAAYAANDLQGLTEVWNCIKSMRSRLLNRLLGKLQALMGQLSEANRNLANLQMSTPYKMLVDYKVPAARPNVEHFYKSLLERQLMELKREINRKDPSRYPPQQAISYTITSTTSTSSIPGWIVI